MNNFIHNFLSNLVNSQPTKNENISFLTQVIISQPRSVAYAFNFWSGTAGVTSKSDCPYNMTVQNVYNINNHGTMYFPGAAQGTQCGDYNSMYMSLLRDRNNRSDADDDDNRDSADYENVEADIELEAVHLWGRAKRTMHKLKLNV